MKWKTRSRIFCAMMAAILLVSVAPFVSDVDATVTETQTLLPFRDLSADEITSEMGVGWNLGNTMDGHTGFMPSETSWQSTETTQELIDAVHDAGFNTIRIPVTWGLKIDDDNNYTIDEAWLSRVQDIVDYCVSQDMYVIINIHHDGAEQAGWLRITAEGEELEVVKAKFARVWEQIADLFKGYDEHLIFESMNEVKGDSDSAEAIKQDFQVINELNQIFVDTVRTTGGNNTRRWLLCPGRYTNIVNTTNDAYEFTLPEDDWNEENRLMVSVHDYDYTFGMVETLGQVNWSEDSALKMGKNFQKLIDKFTSIGVPVVLGEYGAVNKNNTDARAYYYEVIAKLSRISGVVCCAWDQGWYDETKDPDYSFTLFDRTTFQPVYKQITDAILRGYYVASDTDSTSDLSSITKGTDEQSVVVTAFESITPEKASLNMMVGSSTTINVTAEPSNANDVLLYSSSNPAVATVYNGLVRAHGIGNCTITIYSQSGSVETSISVTIYPNDSLSSPITSLTTDAETYRLDLDEVGKVQVSSIPESTDDVITYVSSNADVVTVNKFGKLVAVSEGAAYVTLTTRTGLTKIVRVDVGQTESAADEMEIGLYVYFNDSEHNYFASCEGETITVTGDGSYTLHFDCDENLTEDSLDAGVSSLSNLGAIYIADTSGQSDVLSSCDIFFDSISVDDVPLTMIQTEPHSAIKSNGKFDTNDPINAWDGSVVSEVSVDSYVVNFATATPPTEITVNFTLTNFVFAGQDDSVSEDVAAVAIALQEDSITLASDQTSGFAKAILSPDATTERICFVSDNPAVVWCANDSMKVDEDGVAVGKLYAIGSGEADISVMTESGLSSVIHVVVTFAMPEMDGTADIVVLPAEKIIKPEVVATSTPDPSSDQTSASSSSDDSGVHQEGSNRLQFILISVIICGCLFALEFFAIKKIVERPAKKKASRLETAEKQETLGSTLSEEPKEETDKTDTLT